MDDLDVGGLLPISPPKTVVHHLDISTTGMNALKVGDTIGITVEGDTMIYTITSIGPTCAALGQVTLHCELAWERLDHA